MEKVIKFGEDVQGYTIPVLNEREIRAAAGILFVAVFFAFMLVIFRNDFSLIKYVITAFLTDFIIRVLINPKFSPLLIAGRLIVGNQQPQYVGAKQKKFAWTIGLVLSTIMFILLVVVNAYSPITAFGCLTCLIFLFFETAFGICVGCKIYSLLYKNKIQYCPGEVCDRRSKQDIQKTSWVQLLVISVFAVCILLVIFVLNSQFAKQPYQLFEVNSIIKPK
jgi:hypothetical protein